MPASAPARAEVMIARAACGVTVAVAAAWELALATLVAVKVTEVVLVTLGAVKAPLLEIVPALADQVTAVSAVPLMRAENCCCACDARVVLTGEIESTVPLAELEETVSVKAVVALCPEASVTFAVKGYDPVSAVIPVMTPLEACNWIPDGKAPVVKLHW